ncbi:MAG: monovalent cation/H(+) antiporter subunit G [Pirellulaceae bacterium]
MIVLDVASWFFLLVGAFFSVVGGIGIIRMPEFFSRLHGAGITDTMGAGGILIGLMLQAGASLATVKLVMILFFLVVTSPSSCHALARSALTHGLSPVLETRRDTADS